MLTPNKAVRCSLNSSGGLTDVQIDDGKLQSMCEALSAAIASTELEACMRVKKEDELESLMDELIDTKLRYAHVASELDVERVRTMRLRDKLEKYVSKLTTLEVRSQKKVKG